MAKFLSELDVYLKPDSDWVWIIKSPLIYQSDLIPEIIIVPQKFETDSSPLEDGLFETDFASVPRIPIFYEAFGNRAHREAVIHDYLYRIDSKPVVGFMTANRIFLEAMKERGKSFLVRYGMFYGVCLGGYFSYHKKHVKDKI